MPAKPTRILVLLAGAWLLACSPEPSRVFVPGDGYRETVRAATGQGERARIAVGEALVLHASRRTGPWVPARRESLAPDACWLASAPLPVEPEVAANVRWLVEPTGTAAFNTYLRPDRTRDVRFSVPGVYRLTAQSASWCGDPFRSGPLVVEVVGE